MDIFDTRKDLTKDFIQSINAFKDEWCWINLKEVKEEVLSIINIKEKRDEKWEHKSGPRAV